MVVHCRQHDEEQPIFGRNNRGNVRSCFNICSEKAINITYCECVFVALGIQREMSMLHAMSSLARQILSYFSTLSHKL